MKKILLILSILSLSSCLFQKNSDQPNINKLAKHMNFKEAAYAKDYYKEKKNSDCFINCAERVLAVGGDQDIEQTTRLELAEHYLEQCKYEKANNYSIEYQKLYPGTTEAKRAAFIEIQSYYLATLTSDRDQSDTLKALEHAQDFLKLYPDDTEYTADITNIISTCYKKLLESEIHVIESYLNKYNYYNYAAPLISGQKRIAHIKDKLFPNFSMEEMPELKQKINDLEQTIETELKKYTAVTTGTNG